MNSGVKCRLWAKEYAATHIICERNVGFEIDVGRENLAKACNAQLTFTEIGCEKEKLRIVLRNCFHVGYDGKLVSACDGSNACLDVKVGQYIAN